MGASDADRIGEINASGVVGVARSFRFPVVEGRGASGGHMPCPSCGAPTRHTQSRDKRGAAGIRRDGRGWRCHQCDVSGDAFTLAALLTLGRAPHGADDYRGIFVQCAAVGLCRAMDDATPTPRPLPTPRPAPVVVVRELQRAPGVADFWRACRPVDLTVAHPSPDDLAASWFLARRGFYAPDVARLDLARLLPGPDFTAWPTWWPASWAPAWRLVVPGFEADGVMAGLHARAVLPGATPKTRWAFGCDAGELLFSGFQGVALLRGEALDIDTVEIVEGATDMIAASLRAERNELRRAVLGVVSGSAPALARVRWPAGVVVLAATDADESGDKYAAQIREFIPATVRVLRKRLSPAGKVSA
ncbi:MAG: hypothetical protein IT370_09390 [Deltaproteobacteria bacterium]|nr:hypothetical protein [Deltaproteobacteria bacterium]